MNLIQTTKHLISNQQGATALEYAIIASLISVVIIGAVTGVGGSMNTLFFQSVNDGLNR